MNKSIITKARITLIRIGKIAPFVVCLIITISYIEDIYALLLNKYIEFNDGVYLDKPISWLIGEYFKYDTYTFVLLFVLSIAVKTCIYNKLACVYLWFNLLEKSYFDFELEPTAIYIICIINIIVAYYLIFKGIKNLAK